MRCFSSLVILALLPWLPAGGSVEVSLNENDYGVDEILTRDYLVLGGGASGTYAAVRLRDHNQSIALVEAQPRLGGHTQTYIDPVSGNSTDLGVLTYINITEVRDFFGRFDVALSLLQLPQSSPKFVDFSKGQLASISPVFNSTALLAWFNSLDPYAYLQYGWNLTYPVPDDLLMPFGDYLTKHGLQDAAWICFEYAQGMGNLLDQPTIYVAKYFGTINRQNLLEGALSTTRLDNSELYVKAERFLGSDVLLGSQVVRLCRSDTGITAVVSTPSGKKLIKAKKLVSTIPPKLQNLGGWDLTQQETHLFGQFNNSAYWTALVGDTGLNTSIQWSNVQLNATFDLARLPGPYGIQPSTIEGAFHVYYSSPYVLTDDEVKQRIVQDVQLVQKLSGMPIAEPQFLAFYGHNPFLCTVATNAIRKGFYRQLYSIQGQKSTYWTGGAWHSYDSSLLWRFTEGLLPLILGG